MSAELDLSHRFAADDPAGPIRCVLEGDLSEADLRQAWREGCRLAAELRRGVLCDVRNASLRWTYPQIHEFVASRAANFERPGHASCRIAIVCRDDVESVRWDFLAMTAQHRGVGVKIFFDAPSAEAWLAQGRAG